MTMSISDKLKVTLVIGCIMVAGLIFSFWVWNTSHLPGIETALRKNHLKCYEENVRWTGQTYLVEHEALRECLLRYYKEEDAIRVHPD